MDNDCLIIIIHRRIEAFGSLPASGNERKTQHEYKHEVGQHILQSERLSERVPFVVNQSSDNVVVSKFLRKTKHQPTNKC